MLARLLMVIALLLPAGTARGIDLQKNALGNVTAYISSQCYTDTTVAEGIAANPCYTCHVRSQAPNYINDHDLQLEYSFPAPALENPFTNLFVDRRAAIAAVADDEILRYVRASNYIDDAGGLILDAKLDAVPSDWDVDGDGAWSGYVPDCHFRFDDAGFDRAPDGTPTGWRAFGYHPLPSTFWPTNGSTDDVLIRLPQAFRESAAGTYDPEVYAVNLAIVEALIKRADVVIDPIDEAGFGVDLDKDGALATAGRIAYDWAPLHGRSMSYVGRAKALQERGEVHLAAGLYPEGTEFLHTVRYIDVDRAAGTIAMAPRMKEVRYMRKTRWQTYADLEEGSLAEAKERAAFPDRIALFDGDSEVGISNGFGWRLQGFIEDARGDLRPQSFEETVFCMGCHGGIGITDDSTFAFRRKFDTARSHARGWYHWTQKSLEGTPEPIRADGRPEYAFYLQQNRAGDEFRGNTEVMSRFFDDDGALEPDALAALADDVTTLLFPSVERALALNKAYREIVREQSFALGRDTVLAPAANVHRRVEQGQATGIEEPVRASLF